MTGDSAPTIAHAHRSLTQLDEAYAAEGVSPRDEGTLSLIVRRPAVGVRAVLDEGVLTEAEGLRGDGWAARHQPTEAEPTPNPDTQITLMSLRAIRAITPDESRWPLAGDQLFVDLDLSLDNLPAGTRLRCGDAVLEVSSVPHRGCGKFVARFGADAMKWVNSADGRARNLRGIYARVVSPGVVRPGDAIAKLAR